MSPYDRVFCCMKIRDESITSDSLKQELLVEATMVMMMTMSVAGGALHTFHCLKSIKAEEEIVIKP